MQIRLLQLPTNIYIWLPDWLPSLPCGPLFDHRHLAVLILLPRLSTNLGKLWNCCNTERRRASGKLWKWMWSGFMLWSRHFYPCYKLATKRLSSTSPLDLGHYLGDMRRWSYYTSCYCILIVYSLYTHCILIVYVLYTHCMRIVYSLYTYRILILLYIHIANDTGCDLSLRLTAVLGHHIITQYAKEGFSRAVAMPSSLLHMNVAACCVVHHAEDWWMMQFANRHQKESKHLPTSLSYKTSKSAINMCKLRNSACM